MGWTIIAKFRKGLPEEETAKLQKKLTNILYTHTFTKNMDLANVIPNAFSTSSDYFIAKIFSVIEDIKKDEELKSKIDELSTFKIEEISDMMQVILEPKDTDCLK